MGAPQLSGPAWISNPIVPQFQSPEMSADWLVRRGTVLYLWQNFPFPGTNSSQTTVFKSTDDGSTWTVLDFSNAPNASGTPYYDVANHRWIGAMVFTPSPGSQHNMFLQNFDFNTETWGPAYNTSGPLAQSLIYKFLVRPDGSFVAIFNLGPSPPPGHSRLQASVVPATLNSWGSTIDVGIAIVPFISSGNVLGCAATVDASGNVHIFYQDSNKTHFMYQQLLASNSLGTSFHWAASTLGTPTSNWGAAVLFGGAVYCPIVGGSFLTNEYVVGTPLSAPVFTIQAPSSVQRAGQSGGTSLIQTDGINLYWCLNWAPSFRFTKYQVFTSPDGVTWTVWPDNATAPYLYDFATSPLLPGISATNDQIHSDFILFPNVVGTEPKGYLFCVTQDLRTGASQTAFLNAELFGAPAPPPGGTQIFSLSIYGWKLFRKDPCDTSTEEVPECPSVDRAV